MEEKKGPILDGKPAPVVETERTQITKPWEPARILKIAAKPGWVRKWVREDLVERFELEGWRLVDNKIEKIKTTGTITDGKPLDSRVRKRELVLMELPEERAKARREYFRKLSSESLIESVEEFKKTAHADGGKSYGKIEVSGGGG
jgi:hypothetical protein